jgi:hypothetical protein
MSEQKPSVYNKSHAKMQVRKRPDEPDDIIEKHRLNSTYDGANSQKARADKEATNNPGPVARPRPDHYETQVTLKRQHEHEVEELQSKHHRKRAEGVARQTAYHNVGPGSPVVMGRLPAEIPEREHLANRQAQDRQRLVDSQDRQRLVDSQDREMATALRQHGHAK